MLRISVNFYRFKMTQDFKFGGADLDPPSWPLHPNRNLTDLLGYV